MKETDLSICDSHSHLTTSLMDVPDIPVLLDLMDQHRVEKMIACGFPFITLPDKRWPYHSYGDRVVEELGRMFPQRFVPFLCGFNPVSPAAPAYVQDGLRERGFKGIGELIIHHGEWDRCMASRPRADHPAVIEILRIAGRAGAPVILHCDFDEAEDLFRALESARGTRVIWAHGGAARGASPGSQQIAQALEAHRNLYIEISFDLWTSDFLDRETGRPAPAWLALLESDSDRFTVGLDLSGMLHTFSDEVRRIRGLLGCLSEKAGQRVAFKNMKRLVKSG